VRKGPNNKNEETISELTSSVQSMKVTNEDIEIEDTSKLSNLFKSKIDQPFTFNFSIED